MRCLSFSPGGPWCWGFEASWWQVAGHCQNRLWEALSSHPGRDTTDCPLQLLFFEDVSKLPTVWLKMQDSLPPALEGWAGSRDWGGEAE